MVRWSRVTLGDGIVEMGATDSFFFSFFLVGLVLVGRRGLVTQEG